MLRPILAGEAALDLAGALAPFELGRPRTFAEAEFEVRIRPLDRPGQRHELVRDRLLADDRPIAPIILLLGRVGRVPVAQRQLAQRHFVVAAVDDLDDEADLIGPGVGFAALVLHAQRPVARRRRGGGRINVAVSVERAGRVTATGPAGEDGGGA